MILTTNYIPTSLSAFSYKLLTNRIFQLIAIMTRQSETLRICGLNKNPI